MKGFHAILSGLEGLSDGAKLSASWQEYLSEVDEISSNA